MMRTRVLWIWSAILLATYGAGGQTMPAGDPPVRVSLRRGEVRDDSALPYRPATLTIRYDSSSTGAGEPHSVIRSVTIRSGRGGPTMLFGATIPKGSPATDLGVVLPALSAEESYTVRLLAGETAGAPVIGEFDLSLDWPAGWVTAGAFLDPQAYDNGDYLPPVWSNRTLQGVFVIAAVACVLLATTLLIRRAGRRVFCATVVVIAAAGGLWFAAGAEPIVVQRKLGDNEDFLLVSCLRDAQFEIPQPYTIPLYYNLDEMAQDQSVIHTSDGLNVGLKSGKVLLFARPLSVKRRADTQPSDGGSGI